MSHSTLSLEAIVLKTYDVGEADRYCILLTRELGRVAARATAARKLTSRLGGSILPFQHVTVQLKESSAGYFLAGAQPLEERRDAYHLASFGDASEGVELLLSLVQEEEPLPEIFAATLSFLRVCGERPHIVLSYTLNLLHHLGSLPHAEDMSSFAELSPEEIIFLEASERGEFDRLPSLSSPMALRSLAKAFLAEQMQGKLKAPEVTASF